MRKQSSRRMLGQVAASVFVVLGVLTIFATLQRQMIYFPTVEGEEELLDTAGNIGLQAWRDAHGKLIGWRSAAQREGGRRVLVFHGNAGHALHRDYYLEGFHAQGVDWDVFLFEYPGYGARGGTPSELDLKAAATEAVEFLLKQDARPIYLVGESLGSGIASYLAGEFGEQISGVLLVTPFTSLPDVAAHHYAFLPVRTLLSERYDSLEALSGYRGPIAFLLAGRDAVVPTTLGQQLYDSFRGPKWLRVEPGAGHNSLPLHTTADWWQEVSHFLTMGGRREAN